MTEGCSSSLSGSEAGQGAEGPPVGRREKSRRGQTLDDKGTHLQMVQILTGLCGDYDKLIKPLSLPPLCVSLPPLVRSPTVIVLISSLIQPISRSLGF